MHSPGPSPSAIEAAARYLEDGALVAFPTETVYGLGADAENPDAVARIYAAKGRPANHPVIVHLAPNADAGRWVTSIPPEAAKLIDAFWPGPLTLILKRASAIPDAVSGGQDSIGLRCPSHPVAQALLQIFRHGQGGIAAPSANRFGRVSPTTAQHVRDEFCDEPLIAAILDGGQSEVGIESTIIDVSRVQEGIAPALLRPGRISAQEIAEVIGRMPDAPTGTAPRASGTLDAHYAPRTPTILLQTEDYARIAASLAGQGKRLALLSFADRKTVVPPASFQYMMKEDPAAYAHDLYAALREADQAGADLILVQAPPATPLWSGINDRLGRAAFSSLGLLSQHLSR